MSYTDFDFPHTSLYTSDLREIIANMRRLEDVVKTFVNTEQVKFADPIIWNITSQYAKTTVVLDTSGNAYLSKQAVPAGIQLNNEDYWQEIFNFTDYTRTANQNLTVNVETNTTRATDSYATDDWLIWNDVLYKVTSPIAVDDTLVIGTNLIHFTVEDFCKAWVTYATNLINQYKDDIDASELTYRQQLAQDIADTTANLQAQLDAAISGATVDSEVILARVEYNGVTATTLGDAIKAQALASINMLPTNPEQWDVLVPNYTVGAALSYTGGSANFEFENTNGYYGFYTEPIAVNGDDVIHFYGYSGYKYIVYSLDSSLLFTGNSGWKANAVNYDYTVPADSAYIIIGISRSDSSIMNRSELNMVLNRVRAASTDIGDKTKHLQFSAFGMPDIDFIRQVTFGNIAIGETVTLNNSNVRFTVKINIKGGRRYKYTVGNGYKLYMYDTWNNVIVTYSGWKTSEDTHVTPTQADALYVLIAKSDDSVINTTDIFDSGFTIIENDYDSMTLSPDHAFDLITNGGIISDNMLEQGGYSRSGQHYLIEANSSYRLRSKHRLLTKADTVYKISFNNPSYAYLLWGDNMANNSSMYTDWLFSDAYICPDMDYDLTIQIRKADDSAISIDDISNFDFKIEIVDKSTLHNDFYDSFWIMHRCGLRDAPENTIAALIKSHEYGHVMCETDVRFSSDNVAYCFHDATVDRMTDGSGDFDQKTSAQINSLTIDNGAHIEDYPGLKIPTLAEMLGAAKKLNMKLVLDNVLTLNDTQLNIVLNLIIDYGMIKNVVIRASLTQSRKIKGINKNFQFFYISGSETEILNTYLTAVEVLPSAVCGWSSRNAPNEYSTVLNKYHNINIPVGMYIYTETEPYPYEADDYISYPFDFLLVDGHDQTTVTL